MISSNNNSGRVFAYTRVSREEQAQGVSLKVQEKEFRAFVAKKMPGLKIAEVLADQGQSAYKIPLFKRENGKLLTQILVPGDTIVFYHLDRAFRSTLDCVNSMAWFKNHGVKVVFISMPEMFAMDPMISDLILYLLSWAAQYESSRISERIKAAKRLGKEAGHKMGGSRPFGRVWLGKSKSEYPVWDQYELAIIAEIERLRNQGVTWEGISWEIETELCRLDGRGDDPLVVNRSPYHKFTDTHGRAWTLWACRNAYQALDRDPELRKNVRPRPELFQVKSKVKR